MFDDLLLLQRGGWEAYLGPLGRHGREMLAYLETMPGAMSCPRGYNPSSWMLELLSHADSAGPSHAAASKIAAAQAVHAKLPASALTSAATVSLSPESQPPTSAEQHPRVGTESLDGPTLQSKLHASSVWAVASKLMDAQSMPEPNAQKVCAVNAASVFMSPSYSL